MSEQVGVQGQAAAVPVPMTIRFLLLGVELRLLSSWRKKDP